MCVCVCTHTHIYMYVYFFYQDWNISFGLEDLNNLYEKTVTFFSFSMPIESAF